MITLLLYSPITNVDIGLNADQLKQVLSELNTPENPNKAKENQNLCETIHRTALKRTYL